MDYQCTMCCEENLIAERDELRKQLCERRECMNIVQQTHTKSFNEIMCRNTTLRHDYNKSLKELDNIEDEHDQLCCEINQIDKKLDAQRESVETLKCIETAKLGDAEVLKKQCFDTVEMRQKFLDQIHTAELEQKDIDKEMVCIQKKLAEIITKETELDKIMCTELNREEHFVSSINENQIKIEKLNRSFQAENTKLQTRLNEKSAEVDAVKQKIKCKETEIKGLKNRITEAEATLKNLLDNCRKEKCKLEMECCKLKNEITAMTSTLTASKAKLCETQKENTALENHMNEQKDVIKLLESTKEQLLQKFKSMKETKESMIAMITTLRGLQETERKNFEKQSAFISQEKCHLNELIKTQMEEIKELQRQIFDMKISKCAVGVSVDNMADTSPLGTCMTTLLNCNEKK